VLAAILTHKPERVISKRDAAPDIRSPLPVPLDEDGAGGYGATDPDGNPLRKPKPKKARKPRTAVAGDTV